MTTKAPATPDCELHAIDFLAHQLYMQSLNGGIGVLWLTMIAYLAVAKLNGIQRDASGFFWDTRSAAQSALRVAKAAIKAGVDRPIPDWARQALAAKWTPPKGWKP
jgi:hypothetical protein